MPAPKDGLCGKVASDERILGAEGEGKGLDMADEDLGGRVGKKTGPKPQFSADHVVDVVLSQNLATVTVSQIASRLGVSSSALYRVFPGREAMIDAALDRIAQEIHLADGTLSWQDQLRQCARMTWDLCEAHEGFAMTLLTFPYPQTHIASHLRAMAAQLETAGLTAELAILALDFVGDTVVSVHMALGNYRDENSAGMRAARARIEAERGIGGELPSMVWEVPSTYEDAVGQKIEIIIRGLETLVASRA